MTILDDLRAAIEQAKPITYYALSDTVPLGKMFRIGPIMSFPEVWLFHPTDFEAKRSELARFCRLVSFNEWAPTPTDIERAFVDTLRNLKAVQV